MVFILCNLANSLLRSPLGDFDFVCSLPETGLRCRYMKVYLPAGIVLSTLAKFSAAVLFRKMGYRDERS